ncbi:hypothetical protein [Ruminococcus sp. HUN007]|uniref:hypothetical protein n=1 Tax=Ruminococcus sp. HUN007 TaxID=1514668 RepID=UPI0005D16C37|nr:hypothetical protein [Ruminococcus sp. HUN007]
MSILRFPKPPDGQKIIAIVVGVIRGILRKISEKASKTESTSDNSSIENIDNIIQLLNEYKESVNIHTIKIENAVFKEIQYYSEELFLILDEYSEKIEGYNIRLRMIKKKINDLSSEFNGNIDNYISKKIIS